MNLDHIYIPPKKGAFADWARPQWDELFMGVAYMMSTMSPDESTKHGAVIVDSNNHIKSAGFNGFPPDCVDDEMPTTRPNKYDVTSHAEDNALSNKTCDVSGMRMYVTGYSCMHCFRRILCNRISEVIYDPSIQSACVTGHDAEMIALMNRSKRTGVEKCKITPFNGDPEVCARRYMEYRKIKIQLGTGT